MEWLGTGTSEAYYSKSYPLSSWNNGIYCLGDSSNSQILAGPSLYATGQQVTTYEKHTYHNGKGKLRPLVAIPKAKFKYTLT